MPTSNPRISVTLQPALAAILRELSALSGNSQSALIAELLEQSTPILERVVTVLRAASTIKGQANAEIAASLEAAQTRLETQLGLQLGEFDEGTRPILEEAEAIRRRRSRTGTRPSQAEPPAAQKTPVSNRGVTPLHRRRPAKQSKGG
jgi:hypothetical protein